MSNLNLMESRRRILLNTPHIRSLSDSALSFKTDVPFKMKECKIHFDPVQDLHGYDHPWSAGGGKNLLNVNNPYTFTRMVDIPLPRMIPSGTTVYVYRKSYSYTVEPSSGNKYPYVVFRDSQAETNRNGIWVNPNGTKSSVVANGDFDTIRLWSNGNSSPNSTDVEVTITDLVVGTVETDSYSPYSNICSITGWDGIEVTKCGKNLFDAYNLEKDQGVANSITIIDENSVTISNSNYQEQHNKYYLLDTTKGYTLSFHRKTISMANSNSLFKVWYEDINGSKTSSIIKLDSVDAELDFSIYFAPGTANFSFGGWSYGGTVELTNIQLEEGSTATPYESYQAESYNIEFPYEAGTVYGGTLDLKSGELVVDMAMVDLGTLTWVSMEHYASGVFRTLYFPEILLTSKLICSNYRTGASSSSSTDFAKWDDNTIHKWLSNAIVYIKDLDFAGKTDEEVKTMLSGVQLCYELSTPQTYQLTPETIRTLKGINNVFSNANGNIDVSFYSH